jgi:protein TonB
MFIGTAILLVAAIVVAIALYWMRSHQPQSSSSAGEQQQTQAPVPAPTPAPAQTPTAAPAQPGAAQQQPTANAPEDQQPQAQAPAAAPQQPQAPAQVPAPSNPAPVASTPASGGAAVKGAVAQQIQPVVSESSSKTIHGTIKVKIRVNVAPDGNVSNAAFDSEGPSRYFAKVAMQAAQQWKFKPARVNGHPAPSEWTLQFQFTRYGSNVTPLETTP